MKKSVQTVVIICVTNNINRNPPYDICHGFIAISSILKKLSNNPNIFICGMLPCGEFFSVSILIISEIINLLKFKCFVTNFHYINHGWTLKNGSLGFSLFHGGSKEKEKTLKNSSDSAVFQ